MTTAPAEPPASADSWELLLQPLDLGPITLRNRVMMGSMHTGSRTAPTTSTGSRRTSANAPAAASG